MIREEDAKSTVLLTRTATELPMDLSEALTSRGSSAWPYISQAALSIDCATQDSKMVKTAPS